MSVVQESPPRQTLARAVPAFVVAAPLLTLTSELLAPREPEGKTAGEEVAFLVDHAARLTASWMLGMVAAAALVAAYVVLADRLVGRGRLVGRIAAVLGALGGVGLAAHYGSMLTTLDVALHDSSLSSAIAAAEDGRAAIATIPLVVLGLNLAIVLISIAAYRAGWVPAWGIGLGVAALVGDFSPTSYNTVLHAVFATALFVLVVRGSQRRTATG
jgi:hypothetical protein